MEKASTPRNRLTRSSAKQVNTPKNIGQDDSAEKNTVEEVKSSARKTRRKLDSKTKTNGDTSNIENRLNNEDKAGDSVNNKPEHEVLNINNKSQDSQNSSPQPLTTSPLISRKSLRTRRSVTPGPELESSASKKMSRSSSYGKLESVSTPTNRRGRRATSESKDFIFTPSKDKIIDNQQDSSSKYIPNYTVRTIEKIVEVNEGEKSSEDEGEIQETKGFPPDHKKGKESESCEMNEQSNDTHVNQPYAKETDFSAHPGSMVSDNTNLQLHSSSSQEICNGIEIVDISENDSEVETKTITKEEIVEETFVTSKSEEKETTQMPCLSPKEFTKSPNPAENQENIKSPDKEVLEKEVINSSKSIDNNSTELVSFREEKINQHNIDRPHDKNQNPDCVIEELVASKEINHSKSVKDEIELVKDPEIEHDDSKELEVFVKEGDQSLPTIESSSTIIGKDVQDNHNESNTSDNKNDVKLNIESENENSYYEMPQIQLLDSSDSEDCTAEEPLITHNSDLPGTVELNECENENIMPPALDINTHENKGLNEYKETEGPVAILDSAPKSGSNDVDGKDDEKQEEIAKDPKCVTDLDDMTSTEHNIEIISDDQRDIENDVSEKDNEVPSLNNMNQEPNIESNNIVNQPVLKVEDSVPNYPENEEDEAFHEPISQDQCPVLEDEKKKIDLEENQVNDEYDIPLSRVSNQSDINSDNRINKSPEKIEGADEKYSDEDNIEDNFSENYENEEVNRSDEGSCDIYKGLSDSGSDIYDKEETCPSGLSSVTNSGSCVSEEESVSSADEDEGDKTDPLNCAEDPKGTDFASSKDGKIGNDKNPNSPMTYDKALAIINKNRVKKIDDEEFFDMFTEELNRVSEQSGSDSDIAIVDEYLMEPEEPTKKNQPKASAQNMKQTPRPSGPTQNNQTLPPESYQGSFNQSLHAPHGTDMNQHGHPIPSQHNHPAMQRMNFPQGSMYQQYDQSFHLRGQMMYNQYAHPSTSMQDPLMFNPPMAHSDVNFSSGMFHHPSSLNPVSDSSYPANDSPLKVRSLSNINSGQPPANKTYNQPDETAFDGGTFEHQDGDDNYMNMSSTSVTQVHNKSDKSTPILDILGLDKESLKLLKKVLGLDIIKKKMKTNLEWQKNCLEKSILKSAQRKRRQKLRKQYEIDERLEGSDSSSTKASSEQSSDESSQSSSGISKKESHTSSSENENREVSIEDGSVFVTLKRKSRHRNKRNISKSSHPHKKNEDTLKQTGKTLRKSKHLQTDRGFGKMPQKQPTEVKSQSGTFIVNPLTASSQSSDSEYVSSDERLQVKSVKRKLKEDLATGKNKLSNMFSQHAAKKVKRTVIEPVLDGPLRKRKPKGLRKLPTDILETLAKEEKKKKRPRPVDSSSEEILEKPKRPGKKLKKMKLKSKAGDQNYIPCVTGGATEFGLSRLDKDGALTLAEKAAKFRTDQLYGASVKRITSKQLINIKKKQGVNSALAKKKKSVE